MQTGLYVNSDVKKNVINFPFCNRDHKLTGILVNSSLLSFDPSLI